MRRLVCILITGLLILPAAQAAGGSGGDADFPRPVYTYGDAHVESALTVLAGRIAAEPFNAAATLIFLCAVVHTFLTNRIQRIAIRLDKAHRERIRRGEAQPQSSHIGAGILHFVGEMETVFGLWAIVLGLAVTVFHDWNTFVVYVSQTTSFTEAMFVVVIMTVAASRPLLRFTELLMWKVAGLFGGMIRSWWFTILTLGPLLGSLITGPAAMTISAFLLAEKFYQLEPSTRFRYATLGLLFVNVSVGGTLTNFASPPVLMVAGPWNWSVSFMFLNFGWKAVCGILLANTAYYFIFRQEMADLQKSYLTVRLKRQVQAAFIHRRELEKEIEVTQQQLNEALGYLAAIDDSCAQLKSDIKSSALTSDTTGQLTESDVEEAMELRFEDVRMATLKKTLPGLLPPDLRPSYRDPDWDRREDWVPAWVMMVHLVFLGWTVMHSHYPALFIGGFLFFLGFAHVTPQYQNRIDLKPALLVGFFLGGLFIHGGLQVWWIEPLLSRFEAVPMMIGAGLLTAINDNAAITYLSTLVPNLGADVRYAVVAGAVAGGGLTVIANAPNPAGRSILKGYFDDGISPAKLLLASLLPTVILGSLFMLLR